MPKQLYVALPCAAARRAMLERALGPGGGVRAALCDADLAKVVEKTAGYSGALLLFRVSCGHSHSCDTHTVAGAHANFVMHTWHSPTCALPQLKVADMQALFHSACHGGMRMPWTGQIHVLAIGCRGCQRPIRRNIARQGQTYGR